MEWNALLTSSGIAVVILFALGLFIWKGLWPFFIKLVDRFFAMWQSHLDALAAARKIEMDQLVASFREMQETNGVQAKAMVEQVDMQREEGKLAQQRHIQVIEEIRDARISRRSKGKRK